MYVEKCVYMYGTGQHLKNFVVSDLLRWKKYFIARYNLRF